MSIEELLGRIKKKATATVVEKVMESDECKDFMKEMMIDEAKSGVMDGIKGACGQKREEKDKGVIDQLVDKVAGGDKAQEMVLKFGAKKAGDAVEEKMGNAFGVGGDKEDDNPLGVVTGFLGGGDDKDKGGGNPMSMMKGFLGEGDDKDKEGDNPMSMVKGFLGGGDDKDKGGDDTMGMVKGFFGGGDDKKEGGGIGSFFSSF